MLFASPLFLFSFLPLTLAGYFLMPKILKNLFLLLVSLFFYAWGDPSHVVLFLIIIVLNYCLGLLIQRSLQLSKILTVSTVLINLGFLIYYKYVLFFLSFLNTIATSLRINPITIPSVILPLGISFIIFHAISYIADIYTKKIKAEKNILDFALYITLFPHLIAGPIVRYSDIGKQMKERKVTISQFSIGISRFVTGLGKKTIIANSMGHVTDEIFKLPHSDLTASLVWLAMIAYSFQIYFDFSGYSDMAIGLARMFGFEFHENFNYPYMSRSIKEFWQRWHLSLSTWFRDYVYFPLGGNRNGILRTCINILIVFLLTGFWHGASFNFIIWGLYFGFFLVIEKLTEVHLKKIWAPLQHLYALLIVFFGWILFRTETLAQALSLVVIMFKVSTMSIVSIMPFLSYKFLIILAIAAVVSMPVMPVINNRLPSKYSAIQKTFSLTAMVLIFLYSVMQIAGDTYNPFIYFRF